MRYRLQALFSETFLTAQEAIDCGLAVGILERAEKTQDEQQDGGLSYADLFPGLAAVAHNGAETGADTPGDDDRPSVARLVRDMQDVVKLIGRVQLPPVSDLIRRKEEREGMDSRRKEDGVQDSLSGEPESVFTQNQDRRETGEMQDGKEEASGLSIVSAAGTNIGNTNLTVSPDKGTGNSYKIKIGDRAELLGEGESVSSWTDWNGSADITAQTGKVITAAECDGDTKAVKTGYTTVTAAA